MPECWFSADCVCAHTVSPGPVTHGLWQGREDPAKESPILRFLSAMRLQLPRHCTYIPYALMPNLHEFPDLAKRMGFGLTASDS